MFKALPRFAIALLLAGFVGSSLAELIKGDLASVGDGYLISDTATDTEWLTPFYTRGQAFNSVAVQGIISTYGFRYATATETRNMIVSNFGNPTTTHPGDTAGLNSAQAFFDLFGINDNVDCRGPLGNFIACPRTQGLTATQGANGTHQAFGMLQFGQTGYMLDALNQFDGTSDPQLGSWLIRDVPKDPAQVPLPGTLTLMAAGLLGLGAARRSRGNSAHPLS